MACVWKFKFTSGPLMKGQFESSKDGMSGGYNTSQKKQIVSVSKRGYWELANMFESEAAAVLPLYCTWRGKRNKKLGRPQIVEFEITKYTQELADYVLEFQEYPEMQMWIKGAEIFLHLIDGNTDLSDIVNELLFPELGYTANVARHIIENTDNEAFQDWYETAQTFLYMTNGDDSLADIANTFIFEQKLERFTIQLAKNMLQHRDWGPFADWKEAETVLFLTGGDEELLDLANDFIISENLTELTFQLATNIAAHPEWSPFFEWVDSSKTFLYLINGDEELTGLANAFIFGQEEFDCFTPAIAKNILEHPDWTFFSKYNQMAKLFVALTHQRDPDLILCNHIVFEECPKENFEGCAKFLDTLRSSGFGEVAAMFMMYTGAYVMEDALYITKEVIEKFSEEKRELSHVKQKRLLDICSGSQHKNAEKGQQRFVYDKAVFNDARKLLDVFASAVQMGESCGPQIDRLKQENERLKNQISQFKISHSKLEVKVKKHVNTHSEASQKLGVLLKQSQQNLQEAQEDIKHLTVENKVLQKELAVWKGDGLEHVDVESLQNMRGELAESLKKFDRALTNKRALERRRSLRREHTNNVREKHFRHRGSQ